jgi:integrase
MPGRRPLSRAESKRLLRVVRVLSPRDRALLTAQWFTGLRISEVLRLRIGDAFDAKGKVKAQIGFIPSRCKGSLGTTRWLPILPELERALVELRGWIFAEFGDHAKDPAMPLFPSLDAKIQGAPPALSRIWAHKVFHEAFARAHVANDGRLGTHSLRKTFAAGVYANSDHDMMVTQAALGHTSMETTQHYLEPDRAAVVNAIRGLDFSRPRRSDKPSPVPALARFDTSLAAPGTGPATSASA